MRSRSPTCMSWTLNNARRKHRLSILGIFHRQKRHQSRALGKNLSFTMPHIRKPPATVEEMIATSTPDPEWSAMLTEQPIPKGSEYGGIDKHKKLSEGMYPRLRTTLTASRPEGV